MKSNIQTIQGCTQPIRPTELVLGVDYVRTFTVNREDMCLATIYLNADRTVSLVSANMSGMYGHTLFLDDLVCIKQAMDGVPCVLDDDNIVITDKLIFFAEEKIKIYLSKDESYNLAQWSENTYLDTLEKIYLENKQNL